MPCFLSLHKWRVVDVYGIFILGTAGCGKSLLASSLAEWLGRESKSVVIVNLDPGALRLPYFPQVDVRKYISLQELMEKYGLGPNGALIMAADLLADQAPRLSEEIAALNPEYAIIDTPGQMELFAFRVSGPYLARELSLDQKMVLYLFDAPFCSDPFNYVSNLFLSVAVHLRFTLPQVNVLTKMDLLSEQTIKTILQWSTVPGMLEATLLSQAGGSVPLLARDLLAAISRLRFDFSMIASSARYFTNFVNLVAAIERTLTRGEKE
ncbi:ATP/GTP-binding protein [Candidatus Hecatella orcuttiae]|uniref:ATP/GTP-binding protein n=1 Tax=Candidatus Hecatella orcuttiae TaxID=1935119 RepID=UPI002867EFF0|nr:ATP/GTP-binding protein [Candidatus Hecatella orcuttiae]